MSHWIESALDGWIAELTDSLLNSDKPRRDLTAFLLNFETDTYNRALADVVKSLAGETTESGQLIGKILALRLSHIASLADIAEAYEDCSANPVTDPAYATQKH